MTTPAPAQAVVGVLAVTVSTLAAGFAFAAVAGSASATRMLPWVLGRGLGVAGYLALIGLTATGLWLRRTPERRGGLSGPTLVWTHVWLAAITAVLVLGHIGALALDSHAGVGWVGTVVPGRSGYRPLAVGLGTVGLYLGLLAVVAVGLAGRLRWVPWLRLHRLASLAFMAVWAHGMLAGSGTATLRPVYLATGLFVGWLWIFPRLQELR